MNKESILNELIECEVQIQTLQARSAELRQRLGFAVVRKGAKKFARYADDLIEAAEGKPAKRMTEAGKAAIRAAQQKRWAKYRKDRKAAKTIKPVAKRTIGNYWASMTADERKAEMARRVAMRSK